jgi:ribosomal protein S14
MINRSNKFLLKDNLKRSLNIKHKYLNILQKSLFHNRYIKKKYRNFFFYKLTLNNIYSKKTRNICLISGENNSINKKFLMSRFQINYNAVANNLQTFKINSW